MKMNIKFVDEPTPGYFRFRRGKVKLMLPGAPGTREFQEAYDDAISQHAPQLRKRVKGRGALKGTLDWAILEFKSNDAWKELQPSTKEVYGRRFDWLSANYGGELLAAFDRRLVKRIRNLPEFKDKLSVADAIVDRLGALWNFADESLDIELPGSNPTLGIRSLHESGDPAPAWPAELCAAFEAHTHKRMVTFYFLGRYTGQRRGDCCDMKWTDFNQATREMYVVQEKTGTKLWVPAPKRLLDYMCTVPREGGEHILMSPKGGKYTKTSITNLVCRITAELGFKTVNSGGKRAAIPRTACAICAVPSLRNPDALRGKSWRCSAT